jgi:two-component system, OmpR family, response regulator ResD
MSRILIADDESHILEVMLDVLEEAGHTVVGVPDGLKALDLLEKERFDLVLLDVMMPRMDGYHVAAKIHGLKNPPKIIIVTSRNYEHDANTLRNIGIAAFLPKPFSNRDLLEVVTTIIGKK